MLLAPPNPSQFLHVEAKHRTALVTLVAAYDGENNGFNFDGYGRGELTLSIPRGWRVRVTCANRGPLTHSCAIVPGPMTITPSFRGAATPILPPGSSTTFSFVASRVGTYRIACLVAGHEEARMYDVLEVTRSGTPKISARAGP
ncbi:MAG TPA: sulfocyanin-like copper-binding protein [Gaiellaceae bacterium]